MHKSRLGGIIIDCQTDDLEFAGSFWSAALGLEKSGEEAEKGYIKLHTDAEDIHIEVQKVDHSSRVHIDIETDDIEAEVRRLEGLGARRLEFVSRWCVMESPTGQRFCVVPAERRGFSEKATKWP
jgi:predicted enzyme related to lactoylglutathione lyase